MQAMAMADGGPSEGQGGGATGRGAVQIASLTNDDLTASLREGWEDFMAKPSHTVFLVLLYPVLGLALTYASSGAALAPLLFPLVAGFALVGPVTAVGVYEISRRREMGDTPAWSDVLSVVRGPALRPILLLALMLVALFVAWMAVAQGIFAATMGPAPPQTVAGFLGALFGTAGGASLIVIGNVVGAAFAFAAMALSVFSMPMAVDGERSAGVAVATSLRAVAANTTVMIRWGLMVGAILMLASIPAFVGLAVALPVLGHATWRLYRRAVKR